MTNIPSATAESFWAALQALTERQAETDRILTERFAETDRQMAETSRQISRLEKQTGGITNNNGAFAEEYFINSLREGQMSFLGEKFDKLIKSAIMEDEHNRIRGELDIMLVNGKSVAIIEVKFRARDKHIDHIIKKVKYFRARFPEYKNHQLYLGLASMVFDENIEDMCKEHGIAIIKQVGDTVVIHDENLRRF